jgi:hypothetical protein
VGTYGGARAVKLIPKRVAIGTFLLGGVGGFLIGHGAGLWLAPLLLLCAVGFCKANAS